MHNNCIFEAERTDDRLHLSVYAWFHASRSCAAFVVCILCRNCLLMMYYITVHCILIICSFKQDPCCQTLF